MLAPTAFALLAALLPSAFAKPYCASTSALASADDPDTWKNLPNQVRSSAPDGPHARRRRPDRPATTVRGRASRAGAHRPVCGKNGSAKAKCQTLLVDSINDCASMENCQR